MGSAKKNVVRVCFVSDEDVTLVKELSQDKKNLGQKKETGNGSLSGSESENEGKDDQVQDNYSYYTFHRRTKCNTSNHTLAKLGRPLLSSDEIYNTFVNVKDKHQVHKDRLFKEIVAKFSDWLALLREGFNLLLYGLGSKISVMQTFKNKMLSDATCVVVKGFLPTVSVQEVRAHILGRILVLTTITRDVIGHQESLSQSSLLEFIKDHYLQPDTEDLYLFICNIDGERLCNAKAKQVFLQLCSVPKIHVIASVDHTNASLLWDQSQFYAMRWVWLEATTFEPYITEASLELLQSDSSSVLSSLKHVFNSLTSNAKKIFLLIAQYQLDHKENSQFHGISFRECYHRCREQFLVNSDLTLKAQLTEFFDHQLLKFKKGPDGGQHLLIPLDGSALRYFTEQQREENVI